MTNFSDQQLSTSVSKHSKQPRLPSIPPATVKTTTAATVAAQASRSQMLQRMRDLQLASGKNGNSSTKATGNAAAMQSKKDESPKMNSRSNEANNGSRQTENTSPPPPPLPLPSQQATSHQQSAPNKIGAGREVWSSAQDLFWDHMKEVQNKWNTLKLNDDIWAKLIYFEQNRRIAKAYVSAPVLTVDGSANGLDGFRIGLSGIENNYRTLNSMSCLRSIGQGIKLKIDNQGNILIRKLGNLNGSANQHQPIVHPLSSSAATSSVASYASSSSSSSSASTSSTFSSSNSQAQCSVWIKDWPSSSSNGSSTNSALESCTMRELEKSDISYKLFDMRKFRFQLENRRLNNENFLDWRQCVSVISFVQTLPGQQTSQRMAAGEKRPQVQHGKLLEDPCWLMIINIIAIDMLKSSVCDRYSSSSPASAQTSEIFSLIQNHQSLLASAAARSPASSRLTGSSNTADPLAALTGQPSHSQTDSASNVVASKKHGQHSDNDGESGRTFNSNNNNGSNGSSAGNLLASERLKKLRSTSSRYRMNTPRMVRLDGEDSIPSYRQYQSAQQLSPTNSNSIYTTFNINGNSSSSRFMNSHLAPTKLHQQNRHNYIHRHHHSHRYHPASHSHFRAGASGDNSSSSTSDYHSASRSTSSSQNNYYHLIKHSAHHNRSPSPAHYPPLGCHPNRQLKQFEQQATNNVNAYNYHDDGRLMFTQKAQLSNKKKNLSLSNFDLSPRQKRLDFRAMRSSIKMNFDDFDGEDDVCDEIIGDLCQLSLEATVDVDIASQRRQLCCELTEELKQNLVNHHECQATHGQPQVGDEEEGKVETKTKEQQQRQQKISRSSIGSASTASSGCADNDYFTSHSSSSMSSSTASNERELFSQPASSSGIAGSSGNTSDEYTYEANKLSPDCSEVEAPIAVAAAGDKLANVNDDTKTVHNKQKTLAAAETTTIKTSDIRKQSGIGAKLHRGDRVKLVEPMIAGDFCCNQIVLPSSHVHHQQAERLEDCDCALTESDESYECDCCCECSYSESVANNQIMPTAAATVAVESALDGGQTVAAATTTCGCGDELIYCRHPHSARLSEDSKPHQTTSWFERRRRYGVILTKSTKFYSPNGNNGRQVNDCQESTQRRSNGNDLNNEEDKFRLTRSTQELSS